MNKEYEELKHDLITYCNSRNRSIYDCTVEFFTDRLSKLQEENAQLLLLRTEAYHEVEKLKYDNTTLIIVNESLIEQNERLEKEKLSWYSDSIEQKSEIESLKGKLKEVIDMDDYYDRDSGIGITSSLYHEILDLINKK